MRFMTHSEKALQNIPMRMVNVGCMMEWMDYTPQPLHVLTDSLEKGGED